MTRALVCCYVPPGHQLEQRLSDEFQTRTGNGVEAAFFLRCDGRDVRARSLREVHAPEGPLVLVGVGPAGCAALAAYVAEERGLDGVSAVVLVDPATAWAERPEAWLCGNCENGQQPKGCGRETTGPDCGTEARLPLGPLEPLRAVAERAREGVRCPACEYATAEEPCAIHTHPRLSTRLILAVCPEAPPCEACGGFGTVAHPSRDPEALSIDCAACSGTGRMLSSAEVARELGWNPAATETAVDSRGFREFADGGLLTFGFISAAALSEHGIAEALRVALEGL